MQKFRVSSPDEMSPVAVLVQNLGNLRLLKENTVELLTDYDGAIDRLVADIDQASNHVHLLYFIFADDATGAKVVAALKRAVERGVTCRVLVDYLGSRRWGRSLDEKLTAAGVQVCRMLRVSRPADAKGFVLLPKRWVAERTLSWFGRDRRHSKDYERRTNSSESMLKVSAIHLLLRRLAPTSNVSKFNYQAAA